MPRDGTGVYTFLGGTKGVSDETISSNAYNANVDDIAYDLNYPRPIVAGGTGANNAGQAMTNLGGELSGVRVVDFATHVFRAGSFYCLANTNGAPNTHAFAGICFSSDPPADPVTNINVVLDVRDLQDSITPGTNYIREKKASIWGSWTAVNTPLSGSGGAASIGSAAITGPPALVATNVQAALAELNTDKVERAAGSFITLNPTSAVNPAADDAGTGIPNTLWISNQLQTTTPLSAFAAAPGTSKRIARADHVHPTDYVTPVTITYASPRTILQKSASGQDAAIQGSMGVSARWQLVLGDNTAESANGGSDFALRSYLDAGSLTGWTPFHVERKTGWATIAGDSTGPKLRLLKSSASGGNNRIEGHTGSAVGSTTQRWSLAIGDTTTESAGDAGSDFTLFSFTNSGVLKAVNMISERTNGNFTIAGGTATKPGGGTWTAPSDARIKTVLGEYKRGLDDILKLRPVQYEYKGNDRIHIDKPSPHAIAAEQGTEFTGLIAQEAELVMPEIVSRKVGYIDDKLVNDLRDIDPSPLVYALINAVRTLTNRIVDLEQRVGDIE